MKESLLTILRDKNTSQKDFRIAAEKLASILAAEEASLIKQKKIPVQTSLSQTIGNEISQKVCLVAILRSGITLLPPFVHFFDEASIGILGIRRDEKTFEPNLYYQNLPSLDKDTLIIILDPMIATGGTLSLAIKLLLEKGAKQSNIIAHSIIAAPQGIKKVQDTYKEVCINTVAIDETLNAKKYIVPGLGDYGDRYFGTIC